MFVSGAYAFVADKASLRVIDVSTRTALREVGSIALPGEIQDVHAVGDILFVITLKAGLFVLKVSEVLPTATNEVLPTATNTATRTPTPRCPTATFPPTATSTPTATPPPTPLPWPTPPITTTIRTLLTAYYNREADPTLPRNHLAPLTEADKAPAAKDPDTLWEMRGTFSDIVDSGGPGRSPSCHNADTPSEFIDCTGKRLALTFNTPLYTGGLFPYQPNERDAANHYYRVVETAGQYALYHAFVRDFDAPRTGTYSPSTGREPRDYKLYHERMIRAYEAHMRSLLFEMLTHPPDNLAAKQDFQLTLTRLAGWLLMPYVRTAQAMEEYGAWETPDDRAAALAIINALSQRIWWEWVVPQHEGPRTAGKAVLGNQAWFDAQLVSNPALRGQDRFAYFGQEHASLRPSGIAVAPFDGLWFDADYTVPGEAWCREKFGFGSPNWDRCLALAKRESLGGSNSPFGQYFGKNDCTQRTSSPQDPSCGETNLGSMAEDWLATYLGGRAGMRIIDRVVTAHDPSAPDGWLGQGAYPRVTDRLGYGVAGFHGGEERQDDLEWQWSSDGQVRAIRTLSGGRHDGETQNNVRYSVGEQDIMPGRVAAAGVRDATIGDTWDDLGPGAEFPGGMENHVPGPSPLYGAVIGSMVLGDKVDGEMSPSLYGGKSPSPNGDIYHRNHPDEFEAWAWLLQATFYRCRGVADPAELSCFAFSDPDTPRAPGINREPLFIAPNDTSVPAPLRHLWRDDAGNVNDALVAEVVDSPDGKACVNGSALAFREVLAFGSASPERYLLTEGGYGAYGLLLQAGGAFMRLAAARYREPPPNADYVASYANQRDTLLVPWYGKMERLVGDILRHFGENGIGYIPDAENTYCITGQGASRAPIPWRGRMSTEDAIVLRARWYSTAAMWYWWYESPWLDVEADKWSRDYTWRSRFAVIGDYGFGSLDPQVEGDVAALVKSWNPEFIVTTGDNNYYDGEASTIDANIGQFYHDFIYPYTGAYGPGAATNRFFPSPGNHDWDSPAGAQPYLDYFTLPGNERYYRFAWPPGVVDFFVLDSDPREPDGNTIDSPQARWLQDQLRQSTARWKIVVMHHSPYTSSTTHESNVLMQWPYRAWGAHAVLAGHAHLYERVVRDGLPYFTNGLGGHPTRYAFGPPIPGSQAGYQADNGAMLVDVYSDPDVMVFKFVNRAGQVIDRFELR